MRRLLPLLPSLVLLAVPSPAGATLGGATIATLAAPSDVAAKAGLLAWTTEDGIVIRDRAGIRPLGVAPQARPFTLEAATAPSLTAPALVYPRCTGTEQASCRLAVTPTATAVEKLVPGTDGAVRGVLLRSGAVVAAVRQPDGSDALRVVRGGRVVETLRPPRRQAGWGPSTIGDMDARGDEVVFVQNSARTTEPQHDSEVWLWRVGRAPRLVTRVGTGGASAGTRLYLGLRLQAAGIVAYLQGRDQANRLERWSRTGHLRATAGLGQTIPEEIVAGAYDGGRFFFVSREYTGQGTQCERVGSDGLEPGTCLLRDSGPIATTSPRPRPASAARP